MSNGGIQKKIQDLENFKGINEEEIHAVIEFGSSLYSPNLLSDGIASAGAFMIHNVKEVFNNITLSLDTPDKPLYYSNNIHIKGMNSLPITITFPFFDENEIPRYPINTVVTIEQKNELGVINIVGESGVTINGVLSTQWENKLIKVTYEGDNIWNSINNINVGNIFRRVINEEGVINDDYVHGEKGRVLYSDPERPLHKIVTDTEPGFMDPDDKIKLDAVDLCPLIMHVETPEIHRGMVYSETFKSILYSEDLVLPTGPFISFETWEEYADFWRCPTGNTATEI